MIGESFGVSARLGLMAALIAVVAGLVLGSIAALCRGKWPDRIIIFITTLFVSVPSFVLATILLLVFCLQPVSYTHLGELRFSKRNLNVIQFCFFFLAGRRHVSAPVSPKTVTHRARDVKKALL